MHQSALDRLPREIREIIYGNLIDLCGSHVGHELWAAHGTRRLYSRSPLIYNAPSIAQASRGLRAEFLDRLTKFPREHKIRIANAISDSHPKQRYTLSPTIMFFAMENASSLTITISKLPPPQSNASSPPTYAHRGDTRVLGTQISTVVQHFPQAKSAEVIHKVMGSGTGSAFNEVRFLFEGAKEELKDVESLEFFSIRCFQGRERCQRKFRRQPFGMTDGSGQVTVVSPVSESMEWYVN